MLSPNQLWQAVLGELELSLSRANFTTWFKNTSIAEIYEDKVIISVPNAFTKSWFEEKYHKFILKALHNITNNQINNIIYKIEIGKANKKPQSIDTISKIKIDTKDTETEFQKNTNNFNLNPKYVFETFVIGESNQLAHSACQAVTREPGTKYNPLFLYGGVGLGKTHLIQAIGHAILKLFPHLKVLYINFEKFTNDYVQAARLCSFDKFREIYRGSDVLLVDDVQFMLNKKKTQDEFFHTFEALHQQNKQIVITSDRSPKELKDLEQRLITRFEWGMIADINIPDYETRIAILKSKCQEKNFSLSNEIIEYLSTYINSNIRELEGALNKISAWYQLNQTEPSMSGVKEILTNFFTSTQKKALNPKRVIEEVANFYEIKIDDLIGDCRKRDLVTPRQIIMYLLREELSSSYPAIGSAVGGRDHTTAIHACNKVIQIMQQDERVRLEIESIRQRLYV